MNEGQPGFYVDGEGNAEEAQGNERVQGLAIELPTAGGQAVIHEDPTGTQARQADYFLDEAGRLLDVRTGQDVTEELGMTPTDGLISVNAVAQRRGYAPRTFNGLINRFVVRDRVREETERRA